MQLLAYIETYGILILYTVLFVGIPASIFGGKFSKFRLCVRIPMYLTISNIYVVFVVQMLQILHISYGPVIWIITLGLTFWGLVKIRGFSPVKVIQQIYYRFQVIASGAVGVKTTILRGFRGLGRTFLRIFKWIKRYLLMNPVETLTLIAISVMLVLIFGEDYSTIYGWRASDTPVHVWWINRMIDNRLFVDGIYPFGYHCVVYLFYALFKIPVFISIKSLGFVSAVYVCITMYAALKSVCKGAASPAIGVLIYFMWTVLNFSGVDRFRDGIPQEYGMIFLLPCIMFLCEFFRLQSAYPKEKGMWKNWDDSKLMVLFMGASVSLTLSVHFYNTIAAMIMLIGAVIGGYLFRVFRPRYLLPILTAGFLGFFVAVLPMGICFALGTPLQGSLRWALGVMGVGEGVGEWEEEYIDPDTQYDPNEVKSDDTSLEIYTRDGLLSFNDIVIENDDNALVGAGNIDLVEENNALETNPDKTIASNAKTPFSIKNFITSMKYNVAFNIAYHSDYRDNPNFSWFIVAVCFAPFVFGLVIWLMDKEQGYAFMAYGMAATFMFMEFALCVTGTVSIMDATRSMCFFYPILMSGISLTVDGAVQVVFGWFRRKWIMAIVSLAILVGAGYQVYESGMYRLGPINEYRFEPNGAIACTTNIIASSENNTWTIISAGDEYRMVEKYGFHAEIIEFLYIINKVNDYSKYAMPTEKVYFYIEKNPLNTGDTISKAFAREPLPNTLGQNAYYGHNRTVVMSKFYYWAETFKKQYPNEMYVYYEDDDFICYCLEQNPYSVLNLAIYYGFNEIHDVDTAEIVKRGDDTWNASDVMNSYKDILNGETVKNNEDKKNNRK